MFEPSEQQLPASDGFVEFFLNNFQSLIFTPDFVGSLKVMDVFKVEPNTYSAYAYREGQLKLNIKPTRMPSGLYRVDYIGAGGVCYKMGPRNDRVGYSGEEFPLTLLSKPTEFGVDYMGWINPVHIDW